MFEAVPVTILTNAGEQTQVPDSRDALLVAQSEKSATQSLRFVVRAVVQCSEALVHHINAGHQLPRDGAVHDEYLRVSSAVPEEILIGVSRDPLHADIDVWLTTAIQQRMVDRLAVALFLCKGFVYEVRQHTKRPLKYLNPLLSKSFEIGPPLSDADPQYALCQHARQALYTFFNSLSTVQSYSSGRSISI